MSCFIMDEKSVSILANFVGDLMNCGYTMFGMGAPASLWESLKDCEGKYYYFETQKIFNRLMDLNVRAFKGRYEDWHNEDIKNAYGYDVNAVDYEHGKYEEGHWLVEKWHYRMAKRLEYFIYQCSEDATWNDNLFKSLKELQTELFAWMVRNHAFYQEAEWGM